MKPKNDFAPRKPPRQIRSKETVDAILTATTRVLVADGYNAANTNRIAEVAGVSIGSLYQYFPSKEALVAALIERHNNSIIELVESKLAELKEKPLEKVLAALVVATIKVHTVNPELHRVFTEQIPRVGQFEKVLDVEKRIVEILSDYFETERERIRPQNLSLAAFIVVQTVEAVTHAAAVNDKDLLETNELSEEITILLSRYLIN